MTVFGNEETVLKKGMQSTAVEIQRNQTSHSIDWRTAAKRLFCLVEASRLVAGQQHLAGEIMRWRKVSVPICSYE